MVEKCRVTFSKDVECKSFNISSRSQSIQDTLIKDTLTCKQTLDFQQGPDDLQAKDTEYRIILFFSIISQQIFAAVWPKILKKINKKTYLQLLRYFGSTYRKIGTNLNLSWNSRIGQHTITPQPTTHSLKIYIKKKRKEKNRYID